MKKNILIIAMFLSSISFAQENYKYIIVPAQFSFLKEVNKYGLNELSKSFFQSEGFEVYYDNDKLPEELAKNRCMALYANALESNNMFVTKIHFELKDCTNTVLLKSELATTKEKDYRVAYLLTFREALSSLKGKINFKKQDTLQIIEVVAFKNEIIPTTETSNNLFAIPIPNGFKIVNAAPKTIMVLKVTSVENVFMAQKEEVSGVLLKKNNSWFFEYYNEDKLISEKVEVKF
jgi:hypothetical protein